MSEGDARIVVAPRELTDLVYRCARTAGVSAGLATTMASEWTAAAIAEARLDAAEAARRGLPVDPTVFDCLCRSAEAFLVSEALLDQIADE